MTDEKEMLEEKLTQKDVQRLLDSSLRRAEPYLRRKILDLEKEYQVTMDLVNDAITVCDKTGVNVNEVLNSIRSYYGIGINHGSFDINVVFGRFLGRALDDSAKEGQEAEKIRNYWGQLGWYYAEHGFFDDAIESFDKSTDEQMKKGSQHIAECLTRRTNRSYGLAAELFEKANLEEKAKDCWKKLGDHTLISDLAFTMPHHELRVARLYRVAGEAYEKAGLKKEEAWEIVAEAGMRRLHFNCAAEAFEMTGLTGEEAWERVADECMKKGNLHDAVTAYEKAGAGKEKKWRLVGDACVEKEAVKLAIIAYKRAGLGKEDALKQVLDAQTKSLAEVYERTKRG